MKLRFRTVLIVVLVLVAGCGAGGGDPTPTPGASSVMSATPTPTPTSTSSAEALYAEAERVYLASLEARWKYELTGDYSEFPSELAEYYGPEYLSLAMDLFEQGKERGIRVEGGVPVVEVSPALEAPSNGADAVLESCYDARGLIVVDAAGAEVSRGILMHSLVYLAWLDGNLKILNMAITEVETCSVR